MIAFENNLEFARRMDAQDPLAAFREEFHFPKSKTGEPAIYLCGNSLGLQPRKAKEYIEQELMDWADLGVEGHIHARHPWLPYHENLTEATARLVGAKPLEVVVMNTLSVNLHLMMASFYRPSATRFKILIEGGAFPSDQYAVESQASFHGHDPRQAIVEIKPRQGELTLRSEDVLAWIEQTGESVALVLLGNVNYLTGQAFDMAAITRAAHAKGCLVGFDLAHGVGNLKLALHDSGADFAVWCSYKYLNAGPGAIAGCFIHERHANYTTLEQWPRFAGWWGYHKQTRFEMKSGFKPIPGAEGWQLSNPPIFQAAALRASMEIFDSAGMDRIRRKGDQLTGYLEFLLDQCGKGRFQVITPRRLEERGSQLSLKIIGAGAKDLLRKLSAAGVFCDFREPDIIRVAPAPLYNSFTDVYRFTQVMSENE